MKHHVIVHTMFRPTINDPQGKALHSALKSLGFEGIESVRQGKIIELEVDCDSDKIQEQVTSMCTQLLANAVTDIFQFEIIPLDDKKA